MAHLRSDNHKLSATVDSLRAELRAERRNSRELANQFAVLKDRLEGTKPRPSDDPAAVPHLPVEVLSPDDTPEDGRLVGTADDGTEIFYAGAANAPPPAIPRNDDDEPPR